MSSYLWLFSSISNIFQPKQTKDQTEQVSRFLDIFQCTISSLMVSFLFATEFFFVFPFFWAIGQGG